MTPHQILQRWIALRQDDRKLLVRAYFELSRLHLELRIYGFGRLLRRIEQRNHLVASVVMPSDIVRAERYAHWIEVAARYQIVRSQCLHRSLVLHRWLFLNSMPSKLCIGVRKENDNLKAHAWVELAGSVVHEPADALSSFQVLQGLSMGR